MSIISEKLKTGYQYSFWVANIMELFERIAYYGQATVLSIFLRNHLHFSEIETGRLSSIFGGLIYFLPIFAGALADKFRFKKSFSIAFLILAIGYFLIGSTGMTAFSSFYGENNLFMILIPILTFTAIGGSFIKPSVLGTVALTTTPESKSQGYAIYYWLVNIGGALGPLIAYFIRDRVGIEYVYMISAGCCLLMFLTTLLFFREPATQTQNVPSLMTQVKNLGMVMMNYRFMIFLLIFSLYWIMFWQIFIIIPFYITDYISPDAPFEIIQSMGSWSIILFQLIINYLTRNYSTRQAIMAGFIVSSLGWLVILINPSLPTIIAGIIVFSFGEQTQAPRYYEYVADLAPEGQTALFQGFSFLPVAIGWFLGGNIGGWLYQSLAKNSQQTDTLFLILFGIGVLATLLMGIYNYFVKISKNG